MIVLLAAATLAATPPAAPPADKDTLLDSLKAELTRSFNGRKGQKDAPLYVQLPWQFSVQPPHPPH